MADPNFFKSAGPLRLGDLASIAQSEISQGSDPAMSLEDVAPLGQATGKDISFLDNKSYLAEFEKSSAGACIVHPDFAGRAPAGMALLLTEKPYSAYARVAQAFYPTSRPAAGIHPTAVVDESAMVGEGTAISANCVIGSRVTLGRDCIVGPGSVIDAGVQVGDGTVIGSNVSLAYCLIGKGCQIHSGARIGTRGFGFSMDPEGFLDVPQLGRVILEDGVEFGANSTADRGAGPDTVIGAGTRIDNLVQIGHNVRIGRNCVLVAQSGVAGSTMLEDFVAVGAQAGVAGHLTIESGARIAAAAGVMRNVQKGQAVAGAPAMPIKEFFRLCALWNRQLKAKGKGND